MWIGGFVFHSLFMKSMCPAYHSPKSDNFWIFTEIDRPQFCCKWSMDLLKQPETIQLYVNRFFMATLMDSRQ